jgi:hypothetical protein
LVTAIFKYVGYFGWLPMKVPNNNVDYQGIGWKSKIVQKRATFSVSINKLVVTGCCLEKGQQLFCYFAKDRNKRPMMVVYLDGRDKKDDGAENVRKTLLF